jgi:sugar lactone lactonase YvrE
LSAVRIVERAGRDRLGEGLWWSAREAALYWVDILGQRLSRLSSDSGAIDEWVMPEMIGWVIERADAPGFVAGLKSGFATITLDPLAITPIGAPEPDLPGNRMNDALADARGRVWAGTMSMDGSRADGSLYRLDSDHRWTRMDSGYHIANGPAISPDGQWLYHTDSAVGCVYRFALDDDGHLGPREAFVTFEKDWGSPDGMTVDRDGGVWIAHWGGGCVSRFTPGGERDRSIALPASQITNCVFAGVELDRMFVTSAADGVEEEHGGALFEIDPGCRGVPASCFAG